MPADYKPPPAGFVPALQNFEKIFPQKVQSAQGRLASRCRGGWQVCPTFNADCGLLRLLRRFFSEVAQDDDGVDGWRSVSSGLGRLTLKRNEFHAHPDDLSLSVG